MVTWNEINPNLTSELQWDWYNRNFTPEQTKTWIDNGLKVDEFEFATYLRSKGYETSQKNLNLEVLRTEWKENKQNVQGWLVQNYTDKEIVEQITFDSTTLELSEKGELTLTDYPNLEIIDIVGDINNNSKNVHNITKVTITNCPKLKEVNITNFINSKKLVITNCPNLEILECANNNLAELVGLEALPKLTELRCNENQITYLNLPKQNNLQKLYCWGNNLTNLDFLKNLNPNNLERLSLNDNKFPKQDLGIFSSFQELKELRIAGTSKPSYFYGSLKPLQKLEKLEILDIRGTDITHGLEYLSDSVKEFHCIPDRPNAQVIDIYEELQPFGGDINKWRAVKLEKEPYLLIAPLLPSQLAGKESEISRLNIERKEKLIRELESSSELAKLFNELSLEQLKDQIKTQIETDWTINPNYTSLHFKHWKITNPLSPSESPLRLYDFNEDKIYLNEKSENKSQEPTKNLNQPYAILSYVWGERDSEAMKSSSTKRDNRKISNSANKAINKAIVALKVINKELPNTPINYLWVDQLCMNQEDKHEKSLEVPKMGKYYDNSTLTLIDMNSKLGEIKNIDLMDMLKIIVNSEWFSRSWTYQEGWLSKWTVFMFDDILVDGRAMAGTWALNQLSYVDGGKYLGRNEFDRGTKKIATPVGWVYYRNGYDSEKDKVELTLTQALYAIKNRKRTEPLDGIYSILGLLPYGKEVEVSYSKSNTPELALQEVMKVAIANGYAEPLSWHGESNETAGLCCLPKLDEYGSTSIVGSVGRIDSILKGISDSTREEDTILISLTNQGLDLAWWTPHYIIHHDYQETMHKLESGFEIEGGLFRKDIMVKLEGDEEEIKLSLLGTKESLESTKKGNILVVLYKDYYGTNKLFALLVKETNQKDVYRRLGLVELANSEEIKLTEKEEKSHKKTIIGTNELQAQIEIPPKQ